MIDGDIIDLIMDHFNILSLSDLPKEKQVLTAEDFDIIVNVAERMYLEQLLECGIIGES